LCVEIGDGKSFVTLVKFLLRLWQLVLFLSACGTAFLAPHLTHWHLIVAGNLEGRPMIGCLNN
jgi:hypothetical protein